ncbi:MAG: ATP-binding protein [Caldilineaceae bacterium]
MRRLQLDRMWVQISLIISAVILLAVLAVFGVGRLLRPEPPPNFIPQQVQTSSEFRDGFRRLVAQSLLTLVISGGVLGTAAGIWISRRMTEPLETLASGAQAIGARNLTYRMPVRGSRELRAVAESFNTMAADLEAAEVLRQNLLADVAHELRTPLTVLQGNLRAILDDVYQLDKGEVARLYDQTRHLHRLVNDLHELAQAEARRLPLNLQDLDITTLVQQTVDMCEPLAEAQEIVLKTEVPPSPILVHADRQRLIQVFQNLLTNALRHTPPGGTITICVTQVDATVQVAVQDSGEGIAAEHLLHIFDRFYRTDHARDRDSGGAGLGLAIVRALVEAHDGHVSATSDGPGCGSIFTVTLATAN